MPILYMKQSEAGIPTPPPPLPTPVATIPNPHLLDTVFMH